jgi:hypothetical protein
MDTDGSDRSPGGVHQQPPPPHFFQDLPQRMENIDISVNGSTTQTDTKGPRQVSTIMTWRTPKTTCPGGGPVWPLQ